MYIIEAAPPQSCRGAQAIFYVPQKPYTTTGTLREQVIYPLTIDQAVAGAAGQPSVRRSIASAPFCTF